MPLFKRKSHENTDISDPVHGHPISVAQPLVTQPAITSDPQDPSTKLSDANEPISKTHAGIIKPNVHGNDHTFHPDPAHVAQPNANQPPGAFDPVDPKRGVEAGTLPRSQEWQQGQGQGQGQEGTAQVIIIEKEKLPFKDQTKAWAKIHRGTILRDHEQKELGQKILAGEVPPQ